MAPISLFDSRINNSTPGVILKGTTTPELIGTSEARVVHGADSSRRITTRIDTSYVVGGATIYVNAFRFLSDGRCRLWTSNRASSNQESSNSAEFTEAAENVMGLALRAGGDWSWDFSILDNADESEPYLWTQANMAAAGSDPDATMRKKVANASSAIFLIVDRSHPNINFNNLTYVAPPSQVTLWSLYDPGVPGLIGIDWDEPSSDATIIDYSIQWRETGTTTWTGSETHTRIDLSETYTIQSLTPGQKYDVRLRARSSAGNSIWSVTLSIDASHNILNLEITSGNFTSGATSLSASSSSVRFIDPTDIELTGGNIEFSNTALSFTGTVKLDKPIILSGGNIEFVDTSLYLTGAIRLDSQLILSHFVIKGATFSRVALVEAEIDNSGWMYQMENDNDQGELLDGTLGLTDDFVITNIRRFSGAFQINDRILPRAISTYFAGVGLDLTVTIQDKDGFASFPVDGTPTSALAAGWIRWVAPQPFLDIISRIVTGDRFLLGFTRGGDISLNGGVFTFGETSLSASVDPVTLLAPLRIDIAGGNFTSGATSLSAAGDIQLVDPADIEISGGNFTYGATSLSVVGDIQLVDPADIEISGGNIEFEDPTLQWMGVVGFKIDIHPPLALGGGEVLFSNPSLTWLGAIEFEDTILKLKGGEVLFSNHSLTWLGAIEFEDTILILGGGEILFSGTSLELVGNIRLAVVPNLILSGGEILFTNTSFVSFGTVDISDPGARVPQRPLGFMASAGNMEIDLSWFGSGVNDSNENAVTAWYFRYRQYSNDGTPSLWTEWTTIPGSGNNTTSYKITSLQNESIYGLQIFAENASGLGIPSVERQVTPSTIPDLRELEYQVLIDIMGDGSFLDSNGRIFDVWPDRIKEDTTVRRGRTFRGSQISHPVAGETSFRLRNDDGRYSPHNAPNFKSNRRATIRMRSVGSIPSGGGTVASSTVITTGQSGFPQQPIDLVATGGDGVVELSWSDSSDATITEYEIWYVEVGETVSVWNKIPGSNADTSSHTVYRLKPGIQYEFRVRSVNFKGSSVLSSVIVQTTIGGWTTIWGGRIEEINYRDKKSRNDTVFVSLLGNISYLSQAEIQTGVLSDESAAEAVWLITRASFTPREVVGNISSNNTLRWWWASDDNALQMASSLEVAEDGSVYETRTGQIIYDGANARNQRALEGVVYSFSDDLTDGTIHLVDTKSIQESKSIRNSVIVPVRQYSASLVDAVLWRYEASILIPPGDVFTLIASHDLDGVGIWFSPIANTDYEARSSSGGGGSDLSSDIVVDTSIFADTVNLQFTNSGDQDVYIINPQLRGRSVSTSSATAIPAEDRESIRESGRRSITLSNSWVDDINVARTLAKSFLADFLNPIDRLVVSFWAGLYPGVASTIDIDDVISIRRRGDVSTYRVLHVIHEFGRQAHLTTLEAVPLPFQDVISGVIILDAGPPLGEGVLGR